MPLYLTILIGLALAGAVLAIVARILEARRLRRTPPPPPPVAPPSPPKHRPPTDDEVRAIIGRARPDLDVESMPIKRARVDDPAWAESPYDVESPGGPSFASDDVIYTAELPRQKATLPPGVELFDGETPPPDPASWSADWEWIDTPGNTSDGYWTSPAPDGGRLRVEGGAAGRLPKWQHINPDGTTSITTTDSLATDSPRASTDAMRRDAESWARHNLAGGPR